MWSDALSGLAPGSPSPGNWCQAAPLGLGEEDLEEKRGRVGEGLPLAWTGQAMRRQRPSWGLTCAAPGWDRPLTLLNQGPYAPRSLGSGRLVSAQFSVVTTLFSEKGLSSSLIREAFAGASSEAWELQAPCA